MQLNELNFKIKMIQNIDQLVLYLNYHSQLTEIIKILSILFVKKLLFNNLGTLKSYNQILCKCI